MLRRPAPGVVLVDEDARHADLDLAGVEVLAPATALGIWEGGLVPVDCRRTVLYRFRAEKVVVAARRDPKQPVVFPGNDLVGVMLPDGVPAVSCATLDQARRARRRARGRRRDARDRRRARGDRDRDRQGRRPP
jgi:hypothetical protein